MSSLNLTYPARIPEDGAMRNDTHPHGRTGYERHGCRCPICRAANALHCAKVRARRLARMRDDEQHASHGTDNGYNAGCRCEACKMTKVIRYARERGYRRHAWRELVTSTYHAAREAWEQLREATTYGYLYHRSSTSRDRSTWSHATYADEHAAFRHAHPPPTLRSVLEGLSGEADSWECQAYV